MPKIISNIGIMLYGIKYMLDRYMSFFGYAIMLFLIAFKAISEFLFIKYLALIILIWFALAGFFMPKEKFRGFVRSLIVE